MTPKIRLPALVTAVALCGCLTVNVYFPEAAIRDLSQQIENEVRREAGLPAAETPPAEGSTGATNGGGLLAQAAGLLAAAVFTTPVHAQAVADPGITNPAIRKLIESRSARVEELNRYKASGVLGESNAALVEIRDLDVVGDLKERAAVQRLVKAENADREKLFREIAAAQGVDLGQLPRIQATYAETIRAMAAPGDWVQSADGEWKRK